MASGRGCPTGCRCSGRGPASPASTSPPRALPERHRARADHRGADGRGHRHRPHAGAARPVSPGPPPAPDAAGGAARWLRSLPAPSETRKDPTMPTRDEVKRSVCDAIDRRASQIVSLGETIRQEPGARIQGSSTPRASSRRPSPARAGPEDRARDHRREGRRRAAPSDGPTFALLGELDGLVVAGHPIADPQTGAAHACGHNAQIAGMLGAAMGLTDAKAISTTRRQGRVLRGARRGVRGRGVARRAGAERAARVPRRQARAAPPRALRRRGPRDDDPHDVAAGDEAGRRRALEQRMHRQDRALHRTRVATPAARRTSASTRSTPPRSGWPPSTRSARRSATRTRSACTRSSPTAHPGERDPRRVRLETYVRGKSVEAILDANAEGRPGAARGRARAGREGRDRDAARATCRCSTTRAWPGYFKANATALLGDDRSRETGHRSGSTDMGDTPT